MLIFFLVCTYVFMHMCSHVLCVGACGGQRSTSVDILNLSLIDLDAHQCSEAGLSVSPRDLSLPRWIQDSRCMFLYLTFYMLRKC